MGTEERSLPALPGGRPDSGSGADRQSGLLLEAARHIEELERGLMALARLPVHADAARLGLLHDLLRRCGLGIAGELKVAFALRTAGLQYVGNTPASSDRTG